MDHEKRHWCYTVWELRAGVAPKLIKANYPGNALIVEVITVVLTPMGKRNLRRHLFLVNMRNSRMPC